MKWFLRFCFLLAFTMLPAMVHANPPIIIGPVTLPTTPKPVAVSAPEFDLVTVSAGLATFVGAGWLLMGWRRNRKD
jgi:hypothetical protein